MTDRQRDQIMKKLGEGKSWAQGVREMSQEHQNRVKGLVLSSISIGLLAANPGTRQAAKQMMKSAGRTLVSALKRTNTVQRGSLWMKQIMKRRDMVKKGAVVLKKSAYSVRDIPFGGYLG